MKFDKQRVVHRLLLGSLLFGMFFGAGNLIFPTSIGQEAGSSLNMASIAFIISGVGLACLALVYVAKSKSSSLEELLSPYGKTYARAFNIALLMTIGPLFALPRTATVPYEVGFTSLFPDANHKIGLLIYSSLFFFVTMKISLRPNKLKEIIGKYINPIFLTCLVLFSLVFFLNPMGSVKDIAPDALYASNSFLPAFEVGYQTMDVLAALVFSYVVINSNDYSKESTLKDKVFDIFYAALFTAILMSIIYYVLTYIGASSRNVFEVASNGGLALGQIFKYYFGSLGTLFLALTITLACLKTSSGLVVAFSNYFSTIIPKYTYKQLVYFTSFIAFIVSNFGLSAIITYAVPVLNFLYPLAIMHVIVGLIFKLNNTVFNKTVLYFTMVASVLEVLKGLSISNPLLLSIVDLYKNLPFAKFGIAWLNFTLLGIVIGLFLAKLLSKKPTVVTSQIVE